MSRRETQELRDAARSLLVWWCEAFDKVQLHHYKAEVHHKFDRLERALKDADAAESRLTAEAAAGMLEGQRPPLRRSPGCLGIVGVFAVTLGITLVAVTATRNAGLKVDDLGLPEYRASLAAESAPADSEPPAAPADTLLTVYGPLTALDEKPKPKPKSFTGRITVYHPKYDGRRTASGSRYVHKGKSVAVPPRKKGSGKPIVPYGTWLTLSWKGKSITVKATDLCPAGSWDLSGGAWNELTKNAKPTVLRNATVTVAEKPEVSR